MAICLYDWTKLLMKKLLPTTHGVISFTSEETVRAIKICRRFRSQSSLEAITRNIALEFAPAGIKANCIRAGVTDTESFRMIPRARTDQSPCAGSQSVQTPDHTKTSPTWCTCFCKDEAAWINGSVIIADGGERISVKP